MKLKSKTLLCLISSLLLIISGIAVYYGESSSGYSYRVFNNKNSISIIGIRDNKMLADFILPQGKSYTLEFENKILCYCTLNEKIFVLTRNPENRSSYIVTEFSEGKLRTPILLNKLKPSSHSKIAADENGRFYALDINGYLHIFNSKGEELSVHKKYFRELICCNNTVFAADNKAVYKVNTKEVKKYADEYTKGFLYRVSDSILGEADGSAFNQSTLISSAQKYANSVCEVKGFLYSFSGNKLNKYSKNGELLSSKDYSYTPFAISEHSGTVVIIRNSSGIFNWEIISPEKLFPKESVRTANSEKTQKPDLSRFRIIKSQIILSEHTTQTEFKKSVEANGYSITFNNLGAGNISTADKVIFTRDKETYEYTFVVKGDLTGEGNKNSRDKDAMFDHLLDVKKLKGVYKTAADMNSDGKLNNQDLILIARAIK